MLSLVWYKLFSEKRRSIRDQEEAPVTDDLIQDFWEGGLIKAKKSDEKAEGYTLNYAESRFTFNPMTNRYEKEYFISLNTDYRVFLFPHIGVAESCIKDDLIDALFSQFGIDGYIDDYVDMHEYLKTHPDEVIASAIRISGYDHYNVWEVGFFVNKPVSIPDYLISHPKIFDEIESVV